MPKPDFSHEASYQVQGLWPVCGIDEAGRGPLAGPVAVAAVILDPDNIPAGLDDSKKLAASAREKLFDEILAKALSVSIALVPHSLIDTLNIRAATLLGMSRAAAGLVLRPGFALVDGRDVPPGLICPAQALVGGDGRSVSIAAASILAKVTRDRLMRRLDKHAPHYGFAAHMGYGTRSHCAAIAGLGATAWHRRSFAPLREILSQPR